MTAFTVRVYTAWITEGAALVATAAAARLPRGANHSLAGAITALRGEAVAATATGGGSRVANAAVRDAPG